jgi:hypothetical protein
MAKHFNISGELTQELLAAGDGVNVQSISLTNVHPTHSCHVDLYIEKVLIGKFYLLKKLELPLGGTFIYEYTKFSNANGEFGLYIKLTKSASETPEVDVIIN